MTTLSFRERNSKVWRVDDYVYKSQPKYLMDNEVWCLSMMYEYGYVPDYERLDVELMRMDYIDREPITDVKAFASNALACVHRMKSEGIRHGDLTMPHVLPVGNNVYVIDWAESRFWLDPRPDKREEGDMYWMERTVKEILGGATCK